MGRWFLTVWYACVRRLPVRNGIYLGPTSLRCGVRTRGVGISQSLEIGQGETQIVGNIKRMQFRLVAENCWDFTIDNSQRGFDCCHPQLRVLNHFWYMGNATLEKTCRPIFYISRFQSIRQAAKLFSIPAFYVMHRPTLSNLSIGSVPDCSETTSIITIAMGDIIPNSTCQIVSAIRWTQCRSLKPMRLLQLATLNKASIVTASEILGNETCKNAFPQCRLCWAF